MKKHVSARMLFLFTILNLSLAPGSSAQIQTYCSNIGGNIACTSYDHGTSTQSYCTSIGGNLSCTTYDDNDRQVQVRQNYEAGQVLGTALGNAITGAIEEYRAHKRTQQAKQDAWNQLVQNNIAKNELACEADPEKFIAPGFTALDCRKVAFLMNAFFHKHQKDFVPDEKNVVLLADALGKVATDDSSQWNEQMFEAAFQSLDKKKLDKKIYVGEGQDRQPW